MIQIIIQQTQINGSVENATIERLLLNTTIKAKDILRRQMNRSILRLSDAYKELFKEQ